MHDIAFYAFDQNNLWNKSLDSNFVICLLKVVLYFWQDLVTEVQRALYITHAEFDGNLEEENDLESLIDIQFTALQKAFRIPHKAGDEARTMVSKKLLTLFRIGKLGPFTLDTVPNLINQTP